jgi:hypothetical protein
VRRNKCFLDGMWKLTVGILAEITKERNKKVYNAGNLSVCLGKK